MNEQLYSPSDGGIQLIDGYSHKLTLAPIGEWNLWGRLREVIVGDPTGTVIPAYQSASAKIVDSEMVALMRNHGGELLKDAVPEFYAAFEAETDALVKVYESRGVKVKRPRQIRPDEAAYTFGHGAMTSFPTDVFWCVGRNVIESSWVRMIPRAMRWSVRECYQEYVDADPSVHVHACPMSSPSGDYYFECSDIMIVGDGNVILGYSENGTSSNARGCEWARRVLEADGLKVTVIGMPDTGILHLYAVLCIIGPRIAIAYEDAFPGRAVPEPLRNWDIIWCDRAEAKETAACAVNLDRRTVLLPKAAPRTCDAAADRGFEVIPVEISAHAKTGGGIRCECAVVYREID